MGLCFGMVSASDTSWWDGFVLFVEECIGGEPRVDEFNGAGPAVEWEVRKCTSVGVPIDSVGDGSFPRVFLEKVVSDIGRSCCCQ